MSNREVPRSQWRTTSDQIASDWRLKKTAYLNDVARNGGFCIISTSVEDNKYVDFAVQAVPLTNEARLKRSHSPSKPFNIDWRVRAVQQVHPYVKELSGAIINLIGTPSDDLRYNPEERNERPYRDMLFPNGLVEVVCPMNETMQELRFNIGYLGSIVVREASGANPKQVWPGLSEQVISRSPVN
jgi:hypothetical protein